MHTRKLLLYIALATAALLVTAGSARALEVGINLDVHQDLNLPTTQLPNDFHLVGRIESGPPGGNWGQPPVLIDHVDDLFLGGTFTCQITPDLTDPGQNWYNIVAHWQRTTPIPFCAVFHLGLLFDVNCHNVIIDVRGYWTRNGQPIPGGFNFGFWPTLGFNVDLATGPMPSNGQFIRIQNGNANGAVEPGEIETLVVGMDVFPVANREELELLLGPTPFRELRLGGLQDTLPWIPVYQGPNPISESNYVWMIDSFFDVFFEGTGFIHPQLPIEVQPGGFLLARERIRFKNNFGQTEYRWVWEFHEAHEADLGDAPDSSNTFLVPMTAYPSGGPPGTLANFPTVFMMGSPPYGPIHWNPRGIAFLGPSVTFENEADIGPDQDFVNNILPLQDVPNLDGADDSVAVPLALPQCTPTNFTYRVNLVTPPLFPFYVNVWFDWNRDGDWDDTMTCPDGTAAPEWAVQNQILPALPVGLNNLTTPTFIPWHPGDGESLPIWMRITLSERQWTNQPGSFGYGGAGPAGGYTYGETEDYYFAPSIELSDFGDAPDPPYPTLLASSGAQHGLGQLFLGALIDGEGNGQPNANATGDDNAGLADEEGVVFNTPLIPGQNATITVTLGGVVIGANLSAWVDFNGDGSWATLGDQIFVAQALNPGANVLTFPVPTTATPGVATFARFRLHTNPGGVPFAGSIPYGEVEDYAVTITEPKWSQKPNPPGAGFDAPSDIWWTPIGQPSKWSQFPDTTKVARHAHDYATGRLTLANDWICEGGLVTDLHWWGTIEPSAGALAGFRLSIHNNNSAGPCLPIDPPAWSANVPIGQITVTETGTVNSGNEPIYLYSYVLPTPFAQVAGNRYWLDISANSVNPATPIMWKWQESSPAPVQCSPASKQEPTPGVWQPFAIAGIELAFVITSDVGIHPINAVVADDFVSDGRPITGLRWWGSYLDDRYAPPIGTDPVHVLDGWFISFHWADDGSAAPTCPPDFATDPAPTVLAVYFAPASAVTILTDGTTDCNNHPIYSYSVDLTRCCLICKEADPRDGSIPGTSGQFNEVARLRYWLDIQAVTGATWVSAAGDECVVVYTGHLPPESGDHFWGWHTSPADSPNLCGALDQACTGVLDHQNWLPAACWQYRNWVKQPWLCMPPPTSPVHMAFELYTNQSATLLMPWIRSQPVGGSFCEGSTVVLAVDACGSPPLHYQWTHDGNNVGGDSSTLSLDPIALTDAGTYQVTVSNAAGSLASDSVDITVWDRGSGDADGNGVVNGLDIRLFISAVLGVADPYVECACDMDGSGDVTTDDVSAFVTELLNG